MFNRSQGYKSVVKWFSLLAPLYTVETSTSGNCSQARTDLDECFRCTEKDIHANPPAQQMINARRNSRAGLQSVGCECIFRFCVILHFVQVYFVLLRPLGEISLLCSANLHTLASQTSTPFNLYNSNVEPPSVYWRGGGAGGTNLLFFRDGKLDVCAPVSVFTATAGKYAAHFMDT